MPQTTTKLKLWFAKRVNSVAMWAAETEGREATLPTSPLAPISINYPMQSKIEASLILPQIAEIATEAKMFFRKEQQLMAGNFIVNVEKGIEVAAEDVLHFLSKAQQVVLKGPQIIAALTVLINGVEKVTADVVVDVTNPLTLVNIPVTVQQIADIKALLPEIKAVLTAAGVKF